MKLSQSLITALMANVLFAQIAVAQYQDLNSEVDAEIEQMYNKQGVQSKNAANTTDTKSTSAVVTQTIVVPQQQAPQQQVQSVQKQPETYVESSPLTNSRADSIRKGRQEEELKTETKIVEKLEQSRLEDERRRADVLFGDKFNTLQNSQQQQVVPVQQAPVIVQPTPVQVQTVEQPVQAPSSNVQPQPIIIQEKESLTRDAVREEVRAALSEDKTAVYPLVEQKYFSAIAGIGQYPDAASIKGNYSLGAAFGTRVDYLLVEGAFIYSNYTLDALYAVNAYNPYYAVYGNFDMDQYQGLISAKYQLLGGMVRPVVGGLVSYSYRKYTNNYQTAYTPEGGSSHAVDLGLTAGIDLEFSNRTTIGVDFKYMFNMSNKLDGTTAAGVTPVEKLKYYTTGIFARVSF